MSRHRICISQVVISSNPYPPLPPTQSKGLTASQFIPPLVDYDRDHPKLWASTASLVAVPTNNSSGLILLPFSGECG